MTIVLRPGTPADATACGTICYEAFKAVCTAHNFPPDFPSPEVASGLLSMLLAQSTLLFGRRRGPKGGIVGSNFLDERSCIVGLGPITVDPTVAEPRHRCAPDAGCHRSLCAAAGRGRAPAAGRLHNRSLCLYTKLGFRTREAVSILQGKALGLKFRATRSGARRRPMWPVCNRICHQVHGFDRGVELRDAIDQKTASVVEHLGRITGYTTGIAFSAHSVAETNQGLMSLIGAAPEFGRPGFPAAPPAITKFLPGGLEAGLKLVFR